MSRKKLSRRVVLLCAHFTRNLAYYRVGHPGEPRSEFWVTVNSNFIDIAVLEWCKLLGDKKGVHHWSKVVSDPTGFEVGLLARLQIDVATFEQYRTEMRAYRDKFLAHLDEQEVMKIPDLRIAQAAVQFYHAIIASEAQPGDLFRLPASSADLDAYYADCEAQAHRIYDKL